MGVIICRNVVKAYYTAGVIYDALLTFGELSEEATDKRKYAKYKAAYIHTCLKNGETPIPGPPNENEGESDDNNAVVGPSNPGEDENITPPQAPENQPEPSTPDHNENSPIEFKPHPTEINGTYGWIRPAPPFPSTNHFDFQNNPIQLINFHRHRLTQKSRIQAAFNHTNRPVQQRFQDMNRPQRMLR